MFGFVMERNVQESHAHLYTRLSKAFTLAIYFMVSICIWFAIFQNNDCFSLVHNSIKENENRTG